MIAAKIYVKMGDVSEAERFCRKAYDTNSKFINGKKSSYQTIMLEERSILLHGLNVAILSANKNLFNFFYEKFRKDSERSSVNRKAEKSVKELKLFNSLFNNNAIDEEDIKIFTSIIDNDNLEVFLSLFNTYTHTEIKAELLNLICKKFPNNSNLFNRYGLALSENGKNEEAENVFIESYRANPKEPSTIFYLTSIYIQNGKHHKIVPLIRDAEINFRDNPEVHRRLLILKQRLQIH
jgi:tetratricopeptide (TPR) repeat protein